MSTGIPFPNISPEIFAISLGSFDFALRWYALAYIAGIILGWRLVIMALRRPNLWRGQTPPLTPAQFDDLLTWIILGVILGGRLGYALFYNPGHYLSAPHEILFLWQGGMAFHGGFLGVVAAVWIYCRRQGIALAPTAALLALGTPIGLMLGRIANFINAELWGRATTQPWGVIFPGAAAQDCGQPFTELCARHPSQLYQATFEGLLLGLLLIWLAWRHHGLVRGWLMTGVFLAGYGISRFGVEFLRQPDAQFITPGNPIGLALHINGWGLTMGQTLTLPMIVLGLWLIRKAPA